MQSTFHVGAVRTGWAVIERVGKTMRAVTEPQPTPMDAAFMVAQIKTMPRAGVDAWLRRQGYGELVALPAHMCGPGPQLVDITA